MDIKQSSGEKPAETIRTGAVLAERPPSPPFPPVVKERNLALDAYRGFIMILLVSNGFGFQELIHNPTYHAIAYQFDHLWVTGRGGVVFYDLIMPAFLFMVGVAMPYAFARRTALGATPRDQFRRVVTRCVRLIAISEIWVSIDEHRAHLEVHNVLFVVAVTYFICYFLMRLRWWQQAAVAAGGGGSESAGAPLRSLSAIPGPRGRLYQTPQRVGATRSIPWTGAL
jgi:predicted acyltransferase